MFAERYVFFASFGFCLLLGWLLSAKRQLLLLAALLVVFYAALTMQRNKEWKNNTTLWTQVIRAAPHSPTGWNNLGLEYEAKGDNDHALKYYEKSVILAPYFSLGHNNASRQYLRRYDYDRAVKELELAVKYDPYNASFRVSLATVKQLRYEKERHNQSPEGKKIQKAIEAITARARKLAVFGNGEEALTLLTGELKKHPEDITLLNDIGAIYMSQGDYKTSIGYFEKAIRIAPGEPDIYMNLGSAFVENEERDKAIAAFRMAQSLNPDNSAANRMLERLGQ
jgi:tetratricopeptide (TPR) repeat protein